MSIFSEASAPATPEEIESLCQDVLMPFADALARGHDFMSSREREVGIGRRSKIDIPLVGMDVVRQEIHRRGFDATKLEVDEAAGSLAVGFVIEVVRLTPWQPGEFWPDFGLPMDDEILEYDGHQGITLRAVRETDQYWASPTGPLLGRFGSLEHLYFIEGDEDEADHEVIIRHLDLNDEFALAELTRENQTDLERLVNETHGFSGLNQADGTPDDILAVQEIVDSLRVL